ncbi:unnamed protein product [Mytilus coruscus]|uniref:Reverse transcriptase/retrotransposon-derived protein RNase H-like domain-containing protein n=1 Tax=Mytilus coruscus TaxID=42192 RepID=A0A6J8C8H0_MYTCO|nr:unnamed protein product [Mytilus coruscus]
MAILIVNTTNRTYKFRKGIAIGRASPVLEENVVSLESTREHSEIENVFETELNVPDAYRSRVLQMLNNNRDSFALKDTELGQTDTVKMRIDTGDHPPKETNYLGFKINIDGVKPDDGKVGAIKTLPTPVTVKEVRSFIGTCSYYRRFIPEFSKDFYSFSCSNKKSMLSFNGTRILKYSLTVTPLLAYPDLKKPCVLYTDAPNDTIGACLTQPCDEEENHLPDLRKEKPIYFLSHKLSDTQSRWSSFEKEALSIHYALQKLDR